MIESRLLVTKQTPPARYGLVAAEHPVGARVGARILERGGNAVDAAVATAFAMTVVEPFMSTIAGSGTMLVHRARRGETVALDFNGCAPARAQASMFRLSTGISRGLFAWPNVENAANERGWLAVAVPGSVAGLALALERYGTMELRDVVLFWIDQGIKIFRVDNPHTKPFDFWRWLIADVQDRHPDTIFLAEAFSRPRVMHRLAKLGFSQSYTYFTWRNTKQELTQYFTELKTMRGDTVGFDQIELVVGAIIYDFGPRGNSLYPDVELGRAALRAAQEGVFPLGARGAGRSATVGKTFSFE